MTRVKLIILIVLDHSKYGGFRAHGFGDDWIQDEVECFDPGRVADDFERLL